MLLCPCCQEQLHRIEMAEFHADECRLCDGIWLENGQPEALVCLSVMPQNMLQPIYFDDSRKRVPEGSRLCPTCRVALATWPIKQVQVDVCEVCRGMWLDRWELQAILKDEPAHAAPESKK